jgi:hypothetical protein
MKLKGKEFHIGETGEHRLGTSGTDPENFSRANAGFARQHEHDLPPLTPIVRPTYKTF